MPQNGVEHGSGGPSFQPDREQAIALLCAAMKSGDIKKIESAVCDNEVTDKEMRQSRVQDIVAKAFPSFCARHADAKDYLEKVEAFLSFIPLGPSVIYEPRIQELAQDLFTDACGRKADIRILGLIQNTFNIDDEYVTESIVDLIQDALADWNHEYAIQLMTSFATAVKYFSQPERSAQMCDALETICDQEWENNGYVNSAKLFAVYKDILASHDQSMLAEKIEKHCFDAIDKISESGRHIFAEDLNAAFKMISAYGFDDERYKSAAADAIDVILDNLFDNDDHHESIDIVIEAVKRYGLRDALVVPLPIVVGKALINDQNLIVEKIVSNFHLTPDELKPAADMCIADLSDDIQNAREFYEDEYEGVVDHEKVHVEIRRHIKDLNSLGIHNRIIAELCLDHDLTDYLMSMRDELGLSRKEWHVASLHGFAQALEGGDFDVITAFHKNDLIADELDKEYITAAAPLLRSIIDLFDIETVSGLIRVVKRERELMNNAKTVGDIFLTKRDLAICHDLHIPLSEGNRLMSSNVDLALLHALKGEDRYTSLLQKLLEHGDQWRNVEETIVGPLKRAAEIFGYGKMFYYCNRKNLSRHDALFQMDKIVALQQFSDLPPQEFFGRIMKHVAMDDTHYDEGTAHHHLNTIAVSLQKDIDSVIAKAAHYTDISKLSELASHFRTKNDVFQSWKTLKKYAELSQLIGQTEILDELRELKAQHGDTNLYRFIETLAFHPTSTVSLNDVMMFWRHPQDFLGKDDNHANEETHERKKPSNYTHIPNLDLSAVELRDALVNGVLDRLQTFTPFEIEYDFNAGELDLRSEIKRALGVRSLGAKGQAKQPNKLYFEMKRICKDYEVNFDSYLKDTAMKLSGKLETALREAAYDSSIGITPAEKEIYRAKISAKSDPDGILAGNDTACCMSFDSGKNVVYMFNPNDAMFTIQRERGDGVWRTVAQSVITKDKNVAVLVPKIVDEFKQEKHLSDVIPPNVLDNSLAYASADNIEVAPNVKADQQAVDAIEIIYADFFAEYLKRYAVPQGLHPVRVPVGMGYTDAVTTLSRERNTYIPLAPISYSDKMGGEVYMLQTAVRIKPSMKKITAPDIQHSGKHDAVNGNAIRHLTFEDTLAVAYLEGKIYQDNQELIVNLHNIENGLIAKDIANELKGRPNMSFKYTDREDVTRGYLFAYEGRMTESDDELDIEDHSLYGKPVIYISDLASDKSNPFIGGRLIQTFFNEYKKQYLDKGIDMPIYFEARESTTYQLLMKQIASVQKIIGVEFEIDDLGGYMKGTDTMKVIVLIPHRQNTQAA